MRPHFSSTPRSPLEFQPAGIPATTPTLYFVAIVTLEVPSETNSAYSIVVSFVTLTDSELEALVLAETKEFIFMDFRTPQICAEEFSIKI